MKIQNTEKIGSLKGKGGTPLHSGPSGLENFKIANVCLSDSSLKLPSFFGASFVQSKLSSAIFKTHRLSRRSKMQIVHPEQTLFAFFRALTFLKYLVQIRSIRVLFLNTNPEFGKMVKNHAIYSNQYFINTKWVGGTLTNWKQVSKSIKAYHRFQWKWDTILKDTAFPQFQKMHKCFSGYNNRVFKVFANGHFLKPLPALENECKSIFKVSGKSHLLSSRDVDTPLGFGLGRPGGSLRTCLKTRVFFNRDALLKLPYSLNLPTQGKGKNPLDFPFESQSSKGLFSSSQISEFCGLTCKTLRNPNAKQSFKPLIEQPDILIVLGNATGLSINQEAIKEANISNIPVIGFVDTDTNIKGITFPIVGNTQNHEFIHFCLNWITRIVIRKPGSF